MLSVLLALLLVPVALATLHQALPWWLFWPGLLIGIRVIIASFLERPV